MTVGKESYILGTAPGKGGLTLGSYRQPFAMDDFKLTYSKPESLSPNLLINSSFEYASNSDIPDCWGGNGERYRTQGLPFSMCTAEGLKEFHEKFYLDKNNAFDGKNSIRVESPFFLLSKITNVMKQNDYIISCYLKTNADTQKVKLGATNDSIKKLIKEKVVEVGKDWKRYELNLPAYSQDKLSFLVKPFSDGKIWVDAVQIEAGNKTTPFMPCWYDSGFSLPEDVNKNQCPTNTKAVIYNQQPKNLVPNKDILISDLKLISQDPLKKRFALSMTLENKANKEHELSVAACLTAKRESEQLKTCVKEFPTAKTQHLNFNGFVIKRDLRVCVNTVISNDQGDIIKQTRQFLDVPQPIRIYTDWSYYTIEKDAGIVVQFDADIKKVINAKLKIEAFVAGYMSYPLSTKIVDLNPLNGKQVVRLPIQRLKAGKQFTVKAQVLNDQGHKVMDAVTDLVKLNASKTDVKINRINRGIYVNGKPFIPYGILVSGMKEKQLEYYKKCGFSYIQLISHWNKSEDNLKFLENCDKLGINAIAFHVARPYSLDPAEAAKVYKNSPALIGIVPNDEIADRIVYDRAIMTKSANPAILNCVNHHFHSYRIFANRIDGFPGDVLSIDRYPFIMQPPGRPQMTNDIFSFEHCLKMLDNDGRRERKPVFIWLQAAERFSKEPTPQQLTWQTYIALVNHCMGFTYFGGVPNSEVVWKQMIQLNKEVQSLKPALFSLEDEPQVTAVGKTTKDNIRILAKKTGNVVTLICVNNSFYPVNAGFDLSELAIQKSESVSVLFENRQLEIGSENILNDTFKPFERHVYRIKLTPIKE